MISKYPVVGLYPASAIVWVVGALKLWDDTKNVTIPVWGLYSAYGLVIVVVTLGDEPTFNSTVVAVGTVTAVLTPAIGSDARGYACSVVLLSLSQVKVNAPLSNEICWPPVIPWADAKVICNTPVDPVYAAPIGVNLPPPVTLVIESVAPLTKVCL